MAWDDTKTEKDRANPLTAAEWNAHVTDQEDRATKTQYQYIPLPAWMWTVYTPLSMGGDGAEFTTEQLSGGMERTYLGFGNASAQYAYLDLDMPDDWDGGNLTLYQRWEQDTADLTDISMNVYGDRIDNAADYDVSLNTRLLYITDTNTGDGNNNRSAESSAFTITGDGDTIRLKLTRNITDSSTADIKVTGLMLKCIVEKAEA